MPNWHIIIIFADHFRQAIKRNIKQYLIKSKLKYPKNDIEKISEYLSWGGLQESDAWINNPKKVEIEKFIRNFIKTK